MNRIYCLQLEIKKNINIEVGSLGKIDLDKGKYVYVGSAQKNFGSRILRHMNKEKKLHWHIDYLTANPEIDVKKVFFKKANKEQECETARRIKGKHVKGFGCSDCRCDSHMFKVDDFNIENL